MKAFGCVDTRSFRIYRHDGKTVVVPDRAFALVTEKGGVLNLPDGAVISIQPDGQVQTRSEGNVGPWERGVVDGGIITYTPDPSSGVAYVFGLRNA